MLMVSSDFECNIPLNPLSSLPLEIEEMLVVLYYFLKNC